MKKKTKIYASGSNVVERVALYRAVRDSRLEKIHGRRNGRRTDKRRHEELVSQFSALCDARNAPAIQCRLKSRLVRATRNRTFVPSHFEGIVIARESQFGSCRKIQSFIKYVAMCSPEKYLIATWGAVSLEC